MFNEKQAEDVDTASMSALEILLWPDRPTGEKFLGVVHEQDDTEYQEMRKQFHSFSLNSQMHNGPVAVEANSILENINELLGEA